MEFVRIHIKQLLIIFLLLLGLILAVFLVQRAQIFKSHASSDAGGLFELKDDSGNTLESEGNNKFKTSSTDVEVSIKSFRK